MYRDEKKGIKELGRLVVDYGRQRGTAPDLFEEEASTNLAAAGQAAPFVPAAPIDRDSTASASGEAPRSQDDHDPKAYLKDLPTLRHVVKDIRSWFTRLEFTYIPDRLRREIKPGHGQGVIVGLGLGLLLGMIALLILLRAAGVTAR